MNSATKTFRDQETQTLEKRILDNPWYKAAQEKWLDDWFKEHPRPRYRVIRGDFMNPYDDDVELEEIKDDEPDTPEEKPKVMQPLATGDDAPRALLQSPPLTEMQKLARECLLPESDEEKPPVANESNPWCQSAQGNWFNKDDEIN